MKALIALPIDDGNAAVGYVEVFDAAGPEGAGWALLKVHRTYKTHAEFVRDQVFQGVEPRACLTEHASSICNGLICDPHEIAWVYRVYPQGVEVWMAVNHDDFTIRHWKLGRVDWDGTIADLRALVDGTPRLVP